MATWKLALRWLCTLLIIGWEQAIRIFMRPTSPRIKPGERVRRWLSAHSLKEDSEEINANVYEFHRPGHPKVEIVFFHGLQRDCNENAYWSTWTTRHNPTECWLNAWLVDAIGEPRVLSISYDACWRRDPRQGRSDMYLTGENLVTNIINLAEVGQSCPLVLVGHGLGGLVIKEVCLQAQRMFDGMVDENPKRVYLRNFLDNLKGVFFYSTPHAGSSLNDESRLAEMAGIVNRGKSVKSVKILFENTARSNEQFSTLRRRKRWKTSGVGETDETITLDPRRPCIIVKESSARHDMDEFHMVAGDHFSICKPERATSNCFSCLVNFVEKLLAEERDLRLQVSGGLPQSNNFNEGERQAKQVEEMLKEKPSVAIVGVGGIGKTTLAKTVFNRLFRRFEFACFIDDVKGEFKKGRTLEELIKENLLRGGRKTSCVQVWSELKGKKVLLVLDDIDSKDQIQQVLRNQGSRFGECNPLSRVIVTSRTCSRDILQEFHIYYAEFLGAEESHALLCKHALKIYQSAPKELVEKVVNKCGGLPLILEVIGSYLGSEETFNEQLWYDVIEKLSRDAGDGSNEQKNILSRLEVSYNALNPTLQEMFLDIATLFHGWDLRKVKAAWHETWGEPDKGWKSLMDRCLVRLSTRYEDNYPFPDRVVETVWMHEQLRDMGNNIAGACNPTNQMEKYRRVWGATDLLSTTKKSDDNYNSAVMGLQLLSNGSWDAPPKKLNVPVASIAELSELRYLQLENVNVVKSSHDHTFPPNLALLSIRGGTFPFGEINTTSLHHLAVLEVYDSRSRNSEADDVELESRSFQAGLGKLKNLRVLSVSGTASLKQLPTDVCCLKFLQHMHISSDEICELPDSFCNLSSLVDLELHLDRVTKLPEKFGWLPCLCTLELECSIQVLPDSFGQLLQLRMLVLECHTLLMLPESFGQLSNLQEVKLWKCSLLMELPVNFGKLCQLKELKIYHCPLLQSLPESFGQLSSLQCFQLEVCPLSKGLPDSFGKLCQLKELEISHCSSLESLPESFGQLINLQDFQLQVCPLLKGLPGNFGKLCQLKGLKISHCPSLESLPETFGQLSNLQDLQLRDCPLLKELPENFGNLGQLKELNIWACPLLEGLPDSFGFLSSLQILKLQICSLFKGLPGSFGMLSQLKELEIWDCPLLESLPESFGELYSLQDLQLGPCLLLRGLSDNFGNLRQLKELKIQDCPLLDSLPESFGRLSSLQMLKLQICPLFRGLPENFGMLPQLKKLEIWDCPLLESLSEGFGQLSKLQDLELGPCPLLEELPDNFGKLNQLSELMIRDCPLLENFPESFGELSSLQVLNLWNCPLLKVLPDSFGNLCQLKELELWDCPSLEALPGSLGLLSTLQHFKLENCPLLKGLPENVGKLRQLAELVIGDCPSLDSLPDSIGHLSSLKGLELCDCPRLRTFPESFGQLSLEVVILIFELGADEKKTSDLDNSRNADWSASLSEELEQLYSYVLLKEEPFFGCRHRTFTRKERLLREI